MATTNFTQEGIQVDATMDGVIVRKHIAGLAGGRSLDLTSYTAKVVPCGLPIITNGNGTYKPLTPASNAFTLPENYSYAGICGATILAGKGASVITAGVINEKAMIANIAKFFPTGITNQATVSLAALKTALPHLIFEADEPADVPANA